MDLLSKIQQSILLINMVLKIIPETISLRKPPKNIQNEDDSLFIHEYSKVINQTTVSELNNVFVLCDSLFHISRIKFLNSREMKCP